MKSGRESSEVYSTMKTFYVCRHMLNSPFFCTFCIFLTDRPTNRPTNKGRHRISAHRAKKALIVGRTLQYKSHTTYVGHLVLGIWAVERLLGSMFGIPWYEMSYAGCSVIKSVLYTA